MYERIIKINTYCSAGIDHPIPRITFSTHFDSLGEYFSEYFDFLGSQRQEVEKLKMVVKVETPKSSPSARICV